MATVRLKTTPQITFSDTDQPIGAAELNRAAAPLVEIEENGGIKAVHLDIADLVTALGDQLRGQSYLRRRAFWRTDWINATADGISCAAGVATENALDWWAKFTGAAGKYAMIQDAPDTKSDYAAQLVGAASITSTDFMVWVPGDICAQLRGENLVFSIYVKNLTAATAGVIPFVLASDSFDNQTTVVEVFTGASQNILANVWTRVQFTINAASYSTFKLGAFFGLRTTALNSNVKSMHFAQAQLEVGTTATPFVRQLLPAIPKEDDSLIKDFGAEETDRQAVWEMMLVRKGSNEMRRLLNPQTFIKPRLGNTKSYPEWKEDGSNKLVFHYTGADQLLTVPANVTSMTVKCWGAGGADDLPGHPVVLKGGVGAYAKATFTVTPGDQFMVVVGQGVHGKYGVRPYGFAGAGSTDFHQLNGGGLSGIFTGNTPVLATDASRARLIAGGGGAAGQSGNGSNGVQGGNGNDTASGRAGGGADFNGSNGTPGQFAGQGGGGGGYNGGIALGLGGKGGTNFNHASASSVVHDQAAHPSTTVPQNTDPDYQNEAGQPGKPGLVVVTFA